jgi:hypothetical protein
MITDFCIDALEVGRTRFQRHFVKVFDGATQEVFQGVQA